TAPGEHDVPRAALDDRSHVGGPDAAVMVGPRLPPVPLPRPARPQQGVLERAAGGLDPAPALGVDPWRLRCHGNPPETCHHRVAAAPAAIVRRARGTRSLPARRLSCGSTYREHTEAAYAG